MDIYATGWSITEWRCAWRGGDCRRACGGEACATGHCVSRGGEATRRGGGRRGGAAAAMRRLPPWMPRRPVFAAKRWQWNGGGLAIAVAAGGLPASVGEPLAASVGGFLAVEHKRPVWLLASRRRPRPLRRQRRLLARRATGGNWLAHFGCGRQGDESEASAVLWRRFDLQHMRRRVPVRGGP